MPDMVSCSTEVMAPIFSWVITLDFFTFWPNFPIISMANGKSARAMKANFQLAQNTTNR